MCRSSYSQRRLKWFAASSKDGNKKTLGKKKEVIDKVIEEKKKEPIGTKEAVEKKVAGDLHKAANEDTGKEGTTARAAVWTLFLKTAVSDWFRHAAHGSQDHRVGIVRPTRQIPPPLAVTVGVGCAWRPLPRCPAD